MLTVLQRLWNDDEAPTTVEYAIMLVLIAMAVAGFGAGLSGSVTGALQQTIDVLTGAAG